MELPEAIKAWRTELPAEERDGALDAMTHVCEREHQAFQAGVDRVLDALTEWAATRGIVAELPWPAEECIEGEDARPEVWWDSADHESAVSVRCVDMSLSSMPGAKFHVHDGNRIITPEYAAAHAMELLSASRMTEIGSLDDFLKALGVPGVL